MSDLQKLIEKAEPLEPHEVQALREWGAAMEGGLRDLREDPGGRAAHRGHQRAT